MKPIFDAHCDTVQRIVEQNADFFSPGDGHLSFPEMLNAGYRLQVFACFVSTQEYPGIEHQRCRQLVAAVHNLAEDQRIFVPENPGELRTLAAETSGLGLILALEGGEGLGGKADNVAWARDQGVRYITLAWGDNDLVGGAFGEAYGLTELGRNVVRQMESLRILPDTSHISDAGFADLLKSTEGPIIASHSNCRSLCGSPRNLTDHQIEAIAARGGAVGVTYVSGFLTQEAHETQMPIFKKFMGAVSEKPGGLSAAMEAAYAEIEKTAIPAATAIADHIEHVVKIGGMDTVALGSDFDGFRHGPVLNPQGVLGVLDELRNRGWTEDDLYRLCWGNWERVFAWSLS